MGSVITRNPLVSQVHKDSEDIPETKTQKK